jgi:hypothetical protein
MMEKNTQDILMTQVVYMTHSISNQQKDILAIDRIEHHTKAKRDPGNGRNRTAVGSALLDYNLHNDTCYHYTTSP